MIFLHHALGRWTVRSGGRLPLKGRGHRRLLALFLTCNTLRVNAKIAKLSGGTVPPRPLRSAVYESRRSPPVIRVKGIPFSPFNPILTVTYNNIVLYPLSAPSISLLGAGMSRHRPLGSLSHGSKTCYLGSYPVGSTISNSPPPPTHTHHSHPMVFSGR